MRRRSQRCPRTDLGVVDRVDWGVRLPPLLLLLLLITVTSHSFCDEGHH